MNRNVTISVVVIVIAVLAIGIAAGLYVTSKTTSTSGNTSATTSIAGPKNGPIKIVAAENFWGSLVGQLGGNRVSVISVVSDPNADPHEYESNPANAEAIANASFVIVNGDGYDDWALSLISASNTPGQKVLNVQDYLNSTANPGCALKDYWDYANGCSNEHFWYSPFYVNDTEV